MSDAPMVSVVVPWRTDHAERARNWDWCRQWWQTRLPDAEIIVCDAGGGGFNRAASRNLGASRSSGSLLVFADADTVTSSLDAALSLAARGRWVIAHDWYYALQPEPTARLLACDPTGTLPTPSQLGWSDPDRVESVAGVLVIPRDTFAAAGGYNDRFGDTWGGEDRAFVLALETACGPAARSGGYALHLHHPRGPDFADPGWPHNAELLERYREWALGTPGFGDPREDANRPVG